MKTWGGPETKTYYTPDGRVVHKVPSMVEYSVRQEDGTMKTGQRDRNYDYGLLETPPATPKLHCSHCDKWHDTEDEISECEKHQQEVVERGNKMLGENKDRVSLLEEKVDAMMSAQEKILELLEKR